MAKQRVERRLAAILAADMVGYTRLMQADEEGTLARLKALRKEIIDPKIAEHGGRVVKTTGDGILIEFPSVVDAVRNALEVQQSLARRNADIPEDRRIAYRVGVNLGDVIIDGDDILGDGVNLAARLEGLAEPGGICVSGTVREHVAGRLDAVFEDLGEQHLKNIAEPVRVFRVRPGSATRAPAPAVVSDRPSIAVLPFENMSDSREYEFLADGLTEDIITLLARVPGWFVIARNSAFAYKGRQPDIRDVGRELGVRYVVEGSMRPMGERVRITVQLIEAATGNHLWAERFDRAAEDIHEIQDEVTTGIVAQLEPEITRAEVALIKRRPPGNLDAWGYYQKAHGLLVLKGWRHETFAESAELLNKAIELDPDFALAHAYLSLLLALGHMVGLAPGPGPADERAISAAETAMSIDSQDSVVLGYAGCALCDIGQTNRGLEILERAVESNPSNAQAWVAFGSGLISAGKVRKGVEMLQRGMRISPKDNRLAYWGTILAYTLFRLRRVDEALREAQQACRRDDKLYMPRVVLAIILSQLGRSGEAKQAIAEARRISPELGAEDVRPLVGRRGVQILGDAKLLV